MELLEQWIRLATPLPTRNRPLSQPIHLPSLSRRTMATEVIDRDRGFKKAISSFMAADGVEVRVGITGKFRYPKKRGKTQVAKVAGVHKIFDAWSKVFENFASRQLYPGIMNQIRAGMIQGKKAEDMALELIGYPVKRLYIAETGRLLDIESGTGTMKDSIRASVWDGRDRIGGDEM
jgi:hypothetical protein